MWKSTFAHFLFVGGLPVKQVLTGQILLILCCVVYLDWWYRGFRPGVYVSRAGGVNGILLLITAALGMTGIIFSLMPVQYVAEPIFSQLSTIIFGIAAYILLLAVTKWGFHRIVTTELILIVGWTTLEMAVVNKLYAAGAMSYGGLLLTLIVIAAAFLISIVLYVAYYRMEEMKAFYAAMVPLVTEAIAMAVILTVSSIE